MPIRISPKLSQYFKGFCSSPEIIMLFLYMKCRFSLSYRDLEDIAGIRGGSIDHSTLQRWVIKFAPVIDKHVRKYKRPVGNSWRIDEIYMKLKGKWVYLYRAVDSCDNTVEFLLRNHRDATVALAFFRQAFKNKAIPDMVTIDKSESNPSAIKEFSKGSSGVEEDCNITRVAT